MRKYNFFLIPVLFLLLSTQAEAWGPDPSTHNPNCYPWDGSNYFCNWNGYQTATRYWWAPNDDWFTDAIVFGLL